MAGRKTTAIPWGRLLAWYRENRREMPWRGIADPYRVWVSEIMLQQTRIETVKGYYARFLEAFPTVEALAAAPLADVLKRWEGLGYYSRARNLKAAAERIAASGAFPETAKGLRALPGVGAYTAAAIASICHGEAEPVVDGNVTRVAMRLRAMAGDGGGKARDEISEWLRPAVEASGAPGDFNQAIMELGETLCAPKSPRCDECPLCASCQAHALGRPGDFPAKAAKKEIPTRRFAAFIVRDPSGRVLLRQRPAERLLGGLWELPMAEVASAPAARAAHRFSASLGLRASRLDSRGELVHVFTHFRQVLHLWEAGGAVEVRDGSHLVFADPGSLAVTTATRRAIERV